MTIPDWPSLLALLRHDLRQPLAAIDQIASAMADGVLPPAKIDRYGTLLLAEERSLALLWDNLFHLAHRDDFPAQYQPLDLQHSLQQVRSDYRPVSEAKKVPVALETDSGAVVSGDLDALRLAFANLMVSALRFTPGGQTVTIQVSKSGRHAVVKFQDPGLGLMDTDLQQLFSFPHSNQRGSRRYGASGLMLAVAGDICREHRGDISARVLQDSSLVIQCRFPIKNPKV